MHILHKKDTILSMNQNIQTTKYFFILGNNPVLSLAEIFGLLNSGCKNNYTKIITFCKEFLIIELEKKIDANNVIELLGGTIKIGIILDNKPLNIQAGDLTQGIQTEKNKKIYFGFSLYSKKNFGDQIKKLAMNIKKTLKSKGISSRWVISGNRQLSSVVVKKNKLTDKNGFEWCILQNEDKFFWGKTLAVQEFEKYGKRDFFRPKRDIKSGMLPPKLAKIMINLARFEINSAVEKTNCITLLDPFCGSGTILQEALILGIKKIIGSDLSQKAIQDSLQNLKWLAENFNFKTNFFELQNSLQMPQSRTKLVLGGGGKIQLAPHCEEGGYKSDKMEEYKNCAIQTNLKIFHSDARKINELISRNSVDLIVSEPYLGPPLRGGEKESTIHKIIKELCSLYVSTFKEFKKILKKDCCVCVVLPIFVLSEKNKKNIFLQITDEIEKIGFKRIGFEANNYNNLTFGDLNEFKIFKKKFADNFSNNGNIIYGRDDQLIKREIALLKL